MKNIYRFYFIFVIVLIFIFSIIAFFKVESDNKIKSTIDILDYQHDIEKYFTSYGYSESNMNVIVDPYGISPLTALIMFDTENFEKLKVTVKGKNNDNLVYYYDNSFNHYIIVYGLYANYNNEILIEGDSFSKTLYIQTKSLPKDIKLLDNNNLNNELNFVTSNYLYAVDKCNEIRWLLNDSNSGNVSVTKDNHLIVSTNRKSDKNKFTGVQEINLLGKVNYEYYITNSGNNKVDNQYIYVDKFVINRQSGEIINKDNIGNVINNISLYGHNSNAIIKNGIRFGNSGETKRVKKNITIFNYKKLPKKYNVELKKEFDRLVISGSFTNKSYLILDRLFDKGVYKLNKGLNYVNKVNLNGKYNVYIKIDGKLYKTGKYVKF